MQSQVLLTMVLEEEEEDVWHANQVIDCASRALELVMMVIRLHILRQGVRNRTKNWLQASCCIAIASTQTFDHRSVDRDSR